MRRVVTIIFMAVLLIGLIGFIAYKRYLRVEADMENRFNTSQLILARHIGHGIAQALNNIKAEMMITALLPSIQKGDDRCPVEMEDVYNELKGKIKFLYRLDKEGEVTHCFPENAVEQIKDKDSGCNVCIAVPILVSGRPAGVIGACVELSQLIHKEIEPGMMQTGKSGYVWIIDDQGRFIVHPEDEFVGRDAFIVRKERAPEISFEAINRIMREKMMKGKSGADVYVSGWHREQRGKLKKLIAYAPFRIKERQYSVGLVTPASEVTFLSRKNFQHTLLLIGAVILIGLFALLGVLNIDRRRIKHLERGKELGKEIKDSEARYRTLIEEAFDGIFVQRGAKIVFANQHLHDMLGYHDGEMVGMDHWLVYHPEHREITRERAKARIRGEEVVSRYEVKLQRKDGSWFYGKINARVISFAGEPGVVVWIRDITESKRAEEALRQSEEKYRTILESIEDGYYEVDIAGNLTFFNDSLSRILGYSEDELMGINYHHYTAPENSKKAYQAFNQVYRTGKPDKGFNWEVTRKDGTKIYWEVSISLIRDSEGQTSGFRGVIRDITEKKKAEEALQGSEERYRLLFQNSPDLLAQVDKEGRFLTANRAMAVSLGIPMKEVPGKTFFDLMPAEVAQRRLEFVRKALAKGQNQMFEDTREGRYFHIILVPLKIPGQKESIHTIARDITPLKQASEALQQEKAYIESIVSSVPDMLLVVNSKGEISYGNDVLARFAGVELKEVVGKPLGQVIGELKLLTPETAVILMEQMKKRLQIGDLITGVELEMINGRGERVPCIYSASGIKGPDGKVIGEVVLLRDISKRKQAEEVLRQSEQRFREMAALLPNIICEMNMNLHLTYVNTAGLETFGFTQDEFNEGINGMDLIHPDDREKAAKHIKDVSKGIRVVSTEYRMLKKDGSEIIVLLSGAPIYKDDQVVGNRVSVTDITARKQAEEALRYLKEYNEKIVASIPSSLLVLDRNLNIKSVNRTYRETRGIKDEDVVGKNIKEVFPHQILKEGGLLQAFEEALATKEPRILYEVKHVSSDHPEKILNITVSGLRRAEEEEEEEATLILVIEDITERARLREEIRKSRDFMDTIFKTSVDMVVTTDERGIITFVNSAMEGIAGYKEEELIGRHVSVLYDRGRERAKDMMGILTSGQALKSYRLRLLAKQGREIPISVSGSLLKDSQGRVIGTLGFVRDVSKLVKAEEDLREKNKELENFVYVVSHDLKSPIVSMQGFSSMLLNEYREKLGAEGERYLDRIRANASRMEVLISDLLALSRLGRVVGAFKDVSSLDIVNRVCKSLESRLEENRIEVFIGDNLPTIRCDGDRIYQVFENLLVNAVKFTRDAEKPKIEIRHEDKGEFHQFCVKDNGIGIDKEYHRKIFEIFHRLNEIEDAEGTGIGLVIVERIINNHGGKVWVESEKGMGATFYFTLPGQSGHAE